MIVPMKLRPHLATLIVVVSALTPQANADWLIDGILGSPPMFKTVKVVGFLCLSGMKSDLQIAEDKAQVRENGFWAFQPDAHLTADEIAINKSAFDQMWDGLVATSKLYHVKQVDFVGVDTLAVSTQCLDLYYLAVAPRGPVLFKFSIVLRVGDRARIMKIETIVDWDKIKEATRGIAHPADHEKVATISWPVKTPATTQSSTGGTRTAG